MKVLQENKEEFKKIGWNTNEGNEILDAVTTWDQHRFICIMKDDTIQIFTGICDETYDGEIVQHLDCIDDNLDYNIDDIVMWIEAPNIK